MHEPSVEVLTAQSRKGKERQAPQPTDFADKMVALQRRQAHITKPRERADRTQSSSASTPRPPARAPSPRRTRAAPVPSPSIVVSQPSPSADHAPDEHDFSRRLRISPASPRRAEHSSPRPQQGRLYNPHADPVRPRPVVAEPDAMSDAASSAYAPRGPAHLPRRSQPVRASGDPPRLFDPRKDNPHQFNVLQRPGALPSGTATAASSGGMRQTPTPKSSGDWVSASSTSSASYAHSTISSNFTLSSTATDSSTGSALFDNRTPRSEDSAGPSALSSQLKRLYREILSLEARVQSEDREGDGGEEPERGAQPPRVRVLTTAGAIGEEARDADEEAEKERLRRLVQDHKDLVELIYRMLSLTLAPTVPQSLKSIPVKYNLVFRLWNHGFHRLLERLRHYAMADSKVALEHLQEFTYYAYSFYAYLIEEQPMAGLRAAWVESLGDIARYRIAVSSMLEKNASGPSGIAGTAGQHAHAVTAAKLRDSHHLLMVSKAGTPDVSALSDKNASPTPAVARSRSQPRPPRADSSEPSAGIEHEHEHEASPAVGAGAGAAAGAAAGNANAPSVGVAAARAMALEPERERWRQISREWYLRGLLITPGSGKLHHHLGMLSSREAEGEKEELRAVYHFVKSMITVHPFEASRETIQGMWSGPAHARRQAPDASLKELFVHLHWMLLTKVQLDDFRPTLARFEEKLLIEGDDVEERDWIMMAVVNIGAVLEYGRPDAVLRRVAGTGSKDAHAQAGPVGAGGAKVKLMMARKAEAERMDVDDDARPAAPSPLLNGAPAASASASPSASPSAAAAATASPSLAEPHEPALPIALQHALELTFATLAHTLARPVRRARGGLRPAVNPYISVLLTFLATVLGDRRDRAAERVLVRAVPWDALAGVLSGALSRRVMAREAQRERESAGLLLSAGAAPLPEDWCLRGLGWSWRRIYERGFWDRAAGGEGVNLEAEVLDREEAAEEGVDGIIEDEDEEEEGAGGKAGQGRGREGAPEFVGRQVRIARAALKIGRAVSGFVYVPPAAKDGRGEWRVEGALADRVARWREEERREREEEARRLRGTRWVDDEDSMDVDDEEGAVLDESSGDEDEGDSEQVKELKARRRYLQSLLASSQISRSSPTRKRARGPSMHKAASTLRVVPGYTTLVVDTNILLSSLQMFAALVERLQWTVVLPLPVIMELDGLASNHTPLGEAAAAASQYVVAHLRTHAASLKVQTSKGNYLPNLNVRTEQVDFDERDDGASWERNMDDLILRAALWQQRHWVDRSAFLEVEDAMRDTTGASKVVLLSFDRNLRLKARSRELDAANEQELASILAARP